MTRYIITDQELEAIIQASGDVVRGAFGHGDMQKSQDKLSTLEMIVEARELPEHATHLAMQKDDGRWIYERIPK